MSKKINSIEGLQLIQRFSFIRPERNNCIQYYVDMITQVLLVYCTSVDLVLFSVGIKHILDQFSCQCSLLFKLVIILHIRSVIICIPYSLFYNMMFGK